MISMYVGFFPVMSGENARNKVRDEQAECTQRRLETSNEGSETHFGKFRKAP